MSSGSGVAAKPASFAVRAARWSGLVRTWSKVVFSNRPRSARADLPSTGRFGRAGSVCRCISFNVRAALAANQQHLHARQQTALAGHRACLHVGPSRFRRRRGSVAGEHLPPESAWLRRPRRGTCRRLHDAPERDRQPIGGLPKPRPPATADASRPPDHGRVPGAVRFTDAERGLGRRDSLPVPNLSARLVCHQRRGDSGTRCA